MNKQKAVLMYSGIIIVLVFLVVFLSGGLQKSYNAPSQNQNSSSEPGSLTVTRNELSLHNTQGDCWVGYDSKVYDLTSWLPIHPGSAAAIAPYCGTYEEFQSAFTQQHRHSKVNMLEEQVGIYKGELI